MLVTPPDVQRENAHNAAVAVLDAVQMTKNKYSTNKPVRTPEINMKSTFSRRRLDPFDSLKRLLGVKNRPLGEKIVVVFNWCTAVGDCV